MTLPLVRRSLLLAAESRAQALQDRLRGLEAERDLYREQAADAAEEARSALRMVVDWLAEHQFGQRIFNTTAPTLPETAPGQLLDAMQFAQTKLRGRDMVRAGEERFKQQWLEQSKQTAGGSK